MEVRNPQSIQAHDPRDQTHGFAFWTFHVYSGCTWRGLTRVDMRHGKYLNWTFSGFSGFPEKVWCDWIAFPDSAPESWHGPWCFCVAICKEQIGKVTTARRFPRFCWWQLAGARAMLRVAHKLQKLHLIYTFSDKVLTFILLPSDIAPVHLTIELLLWTCQWSGEGFGESTKSRPTYRRNGGRKTYPEDAFKADQHHAPYHVESFLSVPCIHLILERRRGGWRRLLSHVMASFDWQRIISKLSVTTCIKQFGFAKSMTSNHGDDGDVKVSSSDRQFRISGFKDGILQPGAHGLDSATCKLQALCQGPLASWWHKTCLAFFGITLTESIWIMWIWAS